MESARIAAKPSALPDAADAVRERDLALSDQLPADSDVEVELQGGDLPTWDSRPSDHENPF
jgi:hypothetical protein